MPSLARALRSGSAPGISGRVMRLAVAHFSSVAWLFGASWGYLLFLVALPTSVKVLLLLVWPVYVLSNADNDKEMNE